MANIVKNFLGYLKLGEDDEYDDYLDEMEETEEKSVREEKKSPIRNSFSSTTKRFDEEDKVPEMKRERTTKTERTSSSKIVPIRTTNRGLEVCIMKPTSFDDSKDICDMLISGRAAVVNLEGFDVDVAQRIMDFISGSVYSINGKLHQISNYIFIVSPDNVDISGDYLDLLPDAGFEIPTLNRDF
jgi:cell division inhibitor SepF